MIMALSFDSTACTGFWEPSLDAYLPRPGWRWEGLGLPTGQGTLTSLRTGEGGGGEVEKEEGNRRREGGGNFE